MNKTELVKAISNSADVSRATAEKALNGFLSAVEDTLADGGSVVLMGFGTFSVKERSSRTGRNPQTGKPIDIPAQRVVKFKAGARLAEAVK